MIASDIMTRKVCTIHPEASVQEVAQLLSRERISGAPVINADGMIIGIVTEADIISKVDREGLRVANIMSHEIIAVQEEAPVNEIAKLLAERRIKRVPVLCNGKPVGIVSRADIVDAVAHRLRHHLPIALGNGPGDDMVDPDVEIENIAVGLFPGVILGERFRTGGAAGAQSQAQGERRDHGKGEFHAHQISGT